MHESDITDTRNSLDSGLADLPPLLQQAGDKASRMAQRGIDALHEGSQSLRERARQASESTTGYIQAEPVKAILIAAAAGAAMMALFSLLTRRGSSR